MRALSSSILNAEEKKELKKLFLPKGEKGRRGKLNNILYKIVIYS